MKDASLTSEEGSGLVADLPLDEELLAYYERMRSKGALPLTVGELMAIDERQFLRRPGVGKKAVNLLRSLRAAVAPLLHDTTSSSMSTGPLETGTALESSGNPPEPELSGLSLNVGALSLSERNALSSMISKGVCDSSLDSLLGLSKGDVMREPALGRRRWHLVKNIQTRIREALRSPGSLLYSRVIQVSAPPGNTLGDSGLEQLLVDDFESFLLSLDAKARSILTARLGYCRSRVTLSEAGAIGGFTRERARQIQVKCEQLLPVSFRLSQPALHELLSRIPNGDIEERLPFLRSLFSSREAFGEFLELVGSLPAGRLSGVAAPAKESAVKRPLKERFAACGDPATLDELVGIVSEALGWMPDEAMSGIRLLQKQEALTGPETRLLPTFLAKKEAVAHVVARYPAGLPWQDLAVAVRASKVCRTVYPTDRLDQSISDNDYLFLCGRGCYRHVRYFQVEEERIDRDLRLAWGLLESSNQKTSLRALHAANAEHFEHSYFELRYIVRAFGFRFDLHFSGRSGTDTIALSPIDELSTIVRQVEELLASAPRSFSAAQIAETLGIGGAMAYGALVKLRERGRAVRASRATYVSTEAVFQESDIRRLEDGLDSTLETDSRAVELRWLSERLGHNLTGNCSAVAVMDFLECAGLRRGWRCHKGFLCSPAQDLSELERLLDPMQWRDRWADSYRADLEGALRVSKATQTRLLDEHAEVRPAALISVAEPAAVSDDQLALLLTRV